MSLISDVQYSWKSVVHVGVLGARKAWMAKISDDGYDLLHFLFHDEVNGCGFWLRFSCHWMTKGWRWCWVAVTSFGLPPSFLIYPSAMTSKLEVEHTLLRFSLTSSYALFVAFLFPAVGNNRSSQGLVFLFPPHPLTARPINPLCYPSGSFWAHFSTPPLKLLRVPSALSSKEVLPAVKPIYLQHLEQSLPLNPRRIKLCTRIPRAACRSTFQRSN